MILVLNLCIKIIKFAGFKYKFAKDMTDVARKL